MEPSGRLDLDVVRALVRLRDPAGVLSVYLNAGPGEGEGRETAAVALRNALHDLERRERDAGQAAAFRDALDRLAGDLEGLLDPRAGGRGRALFAGIAGGALERVHVQPALPTRVVLERTASVRPLLAVLSACRPAGVADVSRKQVRALEWLPEHAEELASFPVEPETSEWRRMKGPADPGRPAGPHSASQEDRFEHRLAGEHERRVSHLGEPIARLATRCGWDVLLVIGEAEASAPLVEALAGRTDADVVAEPLVTGGLGGGADLAAACAPAIAEARDRRAGALAEAALDAALAGGKGALGVPEALAALAQGRVHLLLLDPERELEGAAAADGRLVTAGVVPPGVASEDLRPEPHLAERMVEQALETGADVVPAGGATRDLLAEHGGVAALLRW